MIRTIDYTKKSITIALTLLISTVLFNGCKKEEKKEEESTIKTTGSIIKLDSSINELITDKAIIEIISEGHTWSEGPVWVASQNMLLFSDVPLNTIFKWTEENGTEEYLKPSGYTGETPSLSNEPGSNGLLLNAEGKLVLCQHGDRRVAIMNSTLDNPTSDFTTIAGGYEGKKFNSPNDAAFNKAGDVFITDPPYGLPKQMEDSTKEIPFQGVYRATPAGEVTLLVDSLTRPNGVALTPNEKTLIVANSDPEKAIWYAFDFTDEGTLTNARVFYDATENTKTGKGLPDGFKIDKQGNVFASGPGGVYIFNPEGKLIGRIKLDEACSNIALADNDKTLFVTNDMYILRVKMR